MRPVVPPDFQIHLWFAALDIDAPGLARLRDLLAPSELARAERFRVPAAARRFIAARAALRRVLGEVTGTDPGSIDLRLGAHGKPWVAFDGLHFNASDSGELAVVALAASEVGVDLELRRRLRDPWRLARRICTEGELQRLDTVAEHELDATLLRLWTIKEAALKAVGTGLTGGLRNVDAEIALQRAPRLRRLLGEHDGWRLLMADPGPDAMCTIVVRDIGKEPTVRQHWLRAAG